MARGVVLAGAVALAVGGACGEPADPAADAVPPDANPACAAITGHTFQTLGLFECGLLPNDETYWCHWTISFGDEFGDDMFSWSASDIEVSGYYSCHGTTVIGRGRPGETWTVEGTYQFDTGILRWDYKDYERLEM